jgi:hypothetical protein
VAKLIRKERLAPATLCRVAREVVAFTLGAGEADLGGGLFKKRIARPGAGKSAGYRVIVAYRPPNTERVLFAYAFAKNTASTVTPQGHTALASVAAELMTLKDDQIAALLAASKLYQVECDEIEQV